MGSDGGRTEGQDWGRCGDRRRSLGSLWGRTAGLQASQSRQPHRWAEPRSHGAAAAAIAAAGGRGAAAPLQVLTLGVRPPPPPAGTKNKVAKLLLGCLKCCFWCLEKFLKFLNRNAYIMVRETGRWGLFLLPLEEGFALLRAECPPLPPSTPLCPPPPPLPHRSPSTAPTSAPLPATPSPC